VEEGVLEEVAVEEEVLVLVMLFPPETPLGILDLGR